MFDLGRESIENTARVIGLNKCNFNPFVGKVSKLLGEIHGSMVRRSMPRCIPCQLY